MFDPFPTFPLPPCNAFRGPLSPEPDDVPEMPYVGLGAIPKHRTPDGRWHHDTADADAWRERVEGGDWAQPLAGYEDCDGAAHPFDGADGHGLCAAVRLDLCNDGPAPLVADGHHEGDPAPVIGWGESVRRVLS